METPQERLFNYYYKLQSREMREEIKDYKLITMGNKESAIKINFKDGSWIRVYQNKNKSIEWY